MGPCSEQSIWPTVSSANPGRASSSARPGYRRADAEWQLLSYPEPRPDTPIVIAAVEGFKRIRVEPHFQAEVGSAQRRTKYSSMQFPLPPTPLRLL